MLNNISKCSTFEPPRYVLDLRYLRNGSKRSGYNAWKGQISADSFNAQENEGENKNISNLSSKDTQPLITSEPRTIEPEQSNQEGTVNKLGSNLRENENISPAHQENAKPAHVRAKVMIVRHNSPFISGAATSTFNAHALGLTKSTRAINEGNSSRKQRLSSSRKLSLDSL